MEKKENLQDKSETKPGEKHSENQNNLNQDKSEDLKEENSLKAEISHEEQIKELEDKLVRTFAEMENQRRRYEKERDDAFNYGGFNFAKETLNLLDNLERSKASLENDEKLKNTEILKKTVDHLNIIYSDMVSIFKKNGIEEIKSIDQKLDPNLHQAMLEIEDDKVEQGTIIQEIQPGFMFGERLLRPSFVGISKKKGDKNDKNK